MPQPSFIRKSVLDAVAGARDAATAGVVMLEKHGTELARPVRLDYPPAFVEQRLAQHVGWRAIEGLGCLA